VRDDSLIDTPAFSWLVRAWNERDNVLKFVSLFIPLEIATAGIKGAPRVPEHVLKELRRIVDENSVGDETLLAHLNSLIGNQANLSLIDRFEILAKKVQPNCWEDDVAAFKKFNKMRNNLVHRGDKTTSQLVTVGKEQVIDLQILVEKYLLWKLVNES